MKRRSAFILMSTDNGMLIVNRLDAGVKKTHPDGTVDVIGVGYQIMEKSSYDLEEADALYELLLRRRIHHGDGVMMLDIGANIGAFTVYLAKKMLGWGFITAIEPQEWVFNALAGNVALNNCFNVRVINAVVGATSGVMQIPVLNPMEHASFGSLELVYSHKNEKIGQDINWQRLQPATMVSIDSMPLERLDLIKIDVEGMEMQVLEGAENTIKKFKPIITVEVEKSDITKIKAKLQQLGYTTDQFEGNNLVAEYEEVTLKAVS